MLGSALSRSRWDTEGAPEGNRGAQLGGAEEGRDRGGQPPPARPRGQGCSGSQEQVTRPGRRLPEAGTAAAAAPGAGESGRGPQPTERLGQVNPAGSCRGGLRAPGRPGPARAPPQVGSDSGCPGPAQARERTLKPGRSRPLVLVLVLVLVLPPSRPPGWPSAQPTSPPAFRFLHPKSVMFTQRVVWVTRGQGYAAARAAGSKGPAASKPLREAHAPAPVETCPTETAAAGTRRASSPGGAHGAQCPNQVSQEAGEACTVLVNGGMAVG